MLQSLHPLYQSLDARRTELLTYVAHLTDEERNHILTLDSWSPLQVMDHLVVVEEWMASPLPPVQDRVLMQGHLFIAFIPRLMRRGWRLPTLSGTVPPPVPDRMGIEQRWERARHLLSQKLEGVTEENRSLPIALHPVVGPLNAQQVLTLLDAHLDYHWRYFPFTKGAVASIA